MNELELTPDTPMERPIDQSLWPTRPLYLVLDGERVTDVSFDDTGHLYREVPEEHDLDYWREFLELSTSLLTYVDGLLISKPNPAAQDGSHQRGLRRPKRGVPVHPGRVLKEKNKTKIRNEEIKMMFTYLRQLTQTDDSKILFILALICGAMILDFASGTLAAWVNPDIEFKSKMGINGIIRKIASIILLVFFIPVSALVPSEIGVATLYTLYLGYLGMEVRSVFENYKKFGFETGPLQSIVNQFLGKKGDE